MAVDLEIYNTLSYNDHELQHVHKKVLLCMRKHGYILFSAKNSEPGAICRVYLHYTIREEPFTLIGPYSDVDIFIQYVKKRYYNKGIKVWPLRKQFEIIDEPEVHDETWDSALNKAESDIYLDMIGNKSSYKEFLERYNNKKCIDNSDSAVNTILDEQIKKLQNDK